MSSEVKSSTKRLIHPPGYHIEPKYDLKHFRKKMDDSSERDYDVVLPLTSMIDMFSMLVIFLLLNFSATGEAYFVNKDIKLPKADNARPIESMPLISITKTSVSLDSEAVGANPVVIGLADQQMPALVASLNRLKALMKNQEDAGLPVKKGINLQADENTDVVYIKRVMNILVTAGFSNINFAVRVTPPPPKDSTE